MLEPRTTTCRMFNCCTVVSIALLGSTLVLWLVALRINPWDHHLSLGDNFHIGVWWRGGWDSRLAFFNDGRGPYCGNIIGFVDDQGKVHPPREREIYFGDTLGVYFRYFRWADSALWTLMSSLWYPTILFVVLPLIWWIRHSRSRSGQTPSDI